MMWRQIRVRLRSLWRWRRQESELDEEIRFHLARETEERIAAGMSPQEARAAAQRDFGNVTLTRELTREAWGWASAEARHRVSELLAVAPHQEPVMEGPQRSAGDARG